MKVLISAPMSKFSGYGNDGIGLTRALMRMGADVYLQPTHVAPPLPKDMAMLFTKPLDAPFDLTIQHVDPGQLGIDRELRQASEVTVAMSMWEFSSLDNLKGRSSLTRRMKDFDVFLGYDSVTQDGFSRYLTKKTASAVLQGGYEPSEWKYVERDWYSDRFGFCMVGQLHDRKDPFVAIQAFHELKNEYPNDFDGAELHLKGQPYDSKVLTPFGWRDMGSLKLGDVVSNPDGGDQLVLGVQELGKRDIYLVKFSDGSEVECTKDHIWDVSLHGRAWKSMTLEEIMNTSLRSGKHLSYEIPITEPVFYAQGGDSLPVDPYLLGLLIGDGSLTKQVRLWSADEEIFARAEALIPEGVFVGARTEGSGVSGVTFRKMQPVMRSLGLMEKRSWEKEIPERYLRTTSADRLALLQGLMDTDGTSARPNNSPSYCTVSKVLANQVVELVQSLGGVATICKVSTSGRDAYQIKVRLSINPFRLTRKAEQWDSVVRKHGIRRKIVSIELSRTAESRCILVSGDSHRYITDNFVVTHNTNIPGLHPAMEQWCPKLRVHSAVWPVDILKKFYEKQHVLLAPSRGEGKNMPALEFQTTGGAVIATNWGGMANWLSPDYAYPLNYKLVSLNPSLPNCKQARADKAQLKELMMHTYKNRNEVKEKALLASKILPQMCSWDSVVEKFFLKIAKACPEKGEKLLAKARMCEEVSGG